MVNKRGLFRIIEAVISILLILAVILVVASRKSPPLEKEDITRKLRQILDEVAKDGELRAKIVKGQSAERDIEDKIKDRLPSLKKEAKICNLNELCTLGRYPNNAQGPIYSEERIIGTAVNVPNPTPKLVKIFVWEESH